jgi:hypothetical protein
MGVNLSRSSLSAHTVNLMKVLKFSVNSRSDAFGRDEPRYFSGTVLSVLHHGLYDPLNYSTLCGLDVDCGRSSSNFHCYHSLWRYDLVGSLSHCVYTICVMREFYSLEGRPVLIMWRYDRRRQHLLETA